MPALRRLLTVLVCCLATTLAAGAAPAAAGDHVALDDYVALGDSYSSGLGTRSYYDTGSSCKQSIYSYPQRLFFDGWPRRANLFFSADVACAGATTADVVAPGQVYAVNPGSTVPGFDPVGTNYVTISIGGNDAKFSDVVTQCAKPWPFTCWGDIDKAQAFIRDQLPGRLAEVYRQIRSQGPRAYVIVVGYPRLFGLKECNLATRISIGEQRRLNQTADLLRDVTRGVVAAAGPGFAFVDPIAAFTGHAVCAADEWLNGLSNPKDESFHPNRRGHALGYLPLVRAAIAASP